MKQKDVLTLVIVGLVAAVISFFVAGNIFSPQKYSTKVPVAPKIDATFPDVKNDPTYNVIFNPNALDLTVPVQIGGSQNQAPFNNR
jgi:hypothetical protein